MCVAIAELCLATGGLVWRVFLVLWLVWGGLVVWGGVKYLFCTQTSALAKATCARCHSTILESFRYFF